MYGTSPEMLQRMYVKGSLQNQGNGFVFQVKNMIESGSLSGIAKVAVDGEERSLEGATLDLNGKVRQVSEISWSSPVYVSYGFLYRARCPAASIRSMPSLTSLNWGG